MTKVRIKTKLRDGNVIYSLQIRRFFFWREVDYYWSLERAQNNAQAIYGAIQAAKNFKSEVIKY